MTFVVLLTKAQFELKLYIAALARDLQDVEDILQETNADIWRKAGSYTCCGGNVAGTCGRGRRPRRPAPGAGRPAVRPGAWGRAGARDARPYQRRSPHASGPTWGPVRTPVPGTSRAEGGADTAATSAALPCGAARFHFGTVPPGGSQLVATALSSPGTVAAKWLTSCRTVGRTGAQPSRVRWHGMFCMSGHYNPMPALV